MPLSGSFRDRRAGHHRFVRPRGGSEPGSRSGLFSVLAAIALLAPASVLAGPCTSEIDRLQARVDAEIDATAGKGPMARESTGALLHHQPTPGSVARAEENLGEGSVGGRALAALARAREADAAGDAAACERELVALRQIVDR